MMLDGKSHFQFGPLALSWDRRIAEFPFVDVRQGTTGALTILRVTNVFPRRVSHGSALAVAIQAWPFRSVNLQTLSLELLSGPLVLRLVQFFSLAQPSLMLFKTSSGVVPGGRTYSILLPGVHY
jgi:hypothetical protein